MEHVMLKTGRQLTSLQRISAETTSLKVIGNAILSHIIKLSNLLLSARWQHIYIICYAFTFTFTFIPWPSPSSLDFTFTFNPWPGRSLHSQFCVCSKVGRYSCVCFWILPIQFLYLAAPSSLALQGALQDVFLQWFCIEWCGQTRKVCIVSLLPTRVLAF